MESLVNVILSSMSTVNKPQRLFMTALFNVLTIFQGKANYRNLSRYCDMSEKRFSRWYRKAFDFADFNARLFDQTIPQNDECIAAIDASFIRKSGKNTEGLGWFYNGCAGESQRGLETSLLSIVHLKSNTAYALEAQQTLEKTDKTRTVLYAEQLIAQSQRLQDMGVHYVVGDAYYSKYKFVNPVVDTGLHMIGKLRVDADLRWLYAGGYSGKGRPKKYDGKVNIEEDLSRFDHDGTLKNNEQIYSGSVYCLSMKRKIKLVVVRWHLNGKIGKALLFSTDIHLKAEKIIEYYRARFQIEFLFRDAKQYTGLIDCQSCKKEAIHTQTNAALSALNLLKFEDKLNKKTNEETVISIASWKRKKFNQHLMDRVFGGLGLDRDCKKVAQIYKQYSDYGAIAA